MVYPFKADSGDWYTKEGLFWIERYESPKDIVSDISKDLRLEVGKTYLDQNGKSVKIAYKKCESCAYPFVSSEGRTYAPGGQFLLLEPSSDNLVCEDLDIINKQKKLEIKSDFKLEVGKTYKTRNGRMIIIVKKRDDEKYPFLSDVGYTYTYNGTFFCNEESTHDIVEEVVFDKKDFIEVGKTYLNRKGEKIKIEREDTNQTVYRFISGNKSYSDIGHFCDKVTEYDLIEEYEISLKIGHLYECCNGTLTRIIKRLYNQTELFLGDNNIAYHKNGKSYGSEKDDFKFNIIEEY